jgi:hypothetical protein
VADGGGGARIVPAAIEPFTTHPDDEQVLVLVGVRQIPAHWAGEDRLARERVKQGRAHARRAARAPPHLGDSPLQHGLAENDALDVRMKLLRRRCRRGARQAAPRRDARGRTSCRSPRCDPRVEHCELLARVSLPPQSANITAGSTFAARGSGDANARTAAAWTWVVMCVALRRCALCCNARSKRQRAGSEPGRLGGNSAVSSPGCDELLHPVGSCPGEKHLIHYTASRGAAKHRLLEARR